MLHEILDFFISNAKYQRKRLMLNCEFRLLKRSLLRWLQRDIHFSLFFFHLRLSRCFLATQLRLSCELLLSCDFAATFLLLSCDLAATFLLLSCGLFSCLATTLGRVRRQAGLFYLKTTWTPINNRQSVLPWLYSIAMKFFAVFTFILVCSTSLAVLPSYSPAIRNNAVMSDEIIKNYFNLGLTAPEIALFLVSVHGIGISLKQLKRILRRLGCTTRRRRSNLNEVVEAAEEELRGSLFGYRATHQRLISQHGLATTREVVRHVLRAFDPERVEHRSQHRLRRRIYRCKGPNYLWHIDGYDKLKLSGFCIHGAVDGLSRRILWLEVASSNNDPSIVAQYFLDYTRQLGVTARIVRRDRRSENGNLAVHE